MTAGSSRSSAAELCRGRNSNLVHPAPGRLRTDPVSHPTGRIAGLGLGESWEGALAPAAVHWAGRGAGHAQVSSESVRLTPASQHPCTTCAWFVCAQARRQGAWQQAGPPHLGNGQKDPQGGSELISLSPSRSLGVRTVNPSAKGLRSIVTWIGPPGS